MLGSGSSRLPASPPTHHRGRIMARRVAGLTTRQVKTLGPGLHADGNGLYLQVDRGARSYIRRYVSPTSGRRRDMGLGSELDISLAEVREANREASRLIRAGIDPIDARRAKVDPAGGQGDVPGMR